ncbi:hypothetical protein [Mucilaginibacter paludis]|uniref:hypothetical protein n=1 Tax=Mucilaginibacter paludis TaxID=423351 RepID=UPI00145E46BB|nr:hypothetical protein [Mucilaginibacter paludis]
MRKSCHYKPVKGRAAWPVPGIFDMLQTHPAYQKLPVLGIAADTGLWLRLAQYKRIARPDGGGKHPDLLTHYKP